MIAGAPAHQAPHAVRPIPVLVLALAITGGDHYKVAHEEAAYQAEIVLAINEGSMLNADKNTGLPVERAQGIRVERPAPRRQARRADRAAEPASTALEVRHAVGDQELREQVEIEVWRNSFVYYDPETPNRDRVRAHRPRRHRRRSRRRVLLARDLARSSCSKSAITARRSRSRSRHGSRHDARMHAAPDQPRARTHRRRWSRSRTRKREHKQALAQALKIQLITIDDQQKRDREDARRDRASRDALADRIAAAGLDLVIEIVAEKRPDRPESKVSSSR